MNVRITKHFDFEASHFLPKVPDGHKCGRMHGHSYRATLAFECDQLELVDGFVVDYAEIALAWESIHESLDHRMLNDVPGLENPTTEVLAPWIHAMFAEATHRRAYGTRVYSHGLSRHFRSVTVEESRTTSCTYPA